jgi:hypothetical protein
MKIVHWLYIFLVINIFYACGDDKGDFCLSNQQSVQTGFYSAHSDKDTTLENTSIYGINRNDSLLYNEETVWKTFLPLSMLNDTSHFIVEANGNKGTLSFVHQKELDFISEECGFIFRFELDTVIYSGDSFIDSVAIDYSSIVYNENIENVKIYIY